MIKFWLIAKLWKLFILKLVQIVYEYTYTCTIYYTVQLWYAYGTKFWRMGQVKFVEDSLQKIWRGIIFKGCLPKLLLGPLFNTLFHKSYFLLFLNKRFHNRRPYFQFFNIFTNASISSDDQHDDFRRIAC